MTYPGEICAECGHKHGRKPEGNPYATWSPGVCDICGEKTYTTEPRDYGHLKEGWDKLPKHQN